MKAKIFLWLAIILSLPVLFFYLNGTSTIFLIMIIFAGFVYLIKVRKVKFDLALMIALLLIFITFLTGSLSVWNGNSIFLNTSAFDLGIIQALFLGPTAWLAGLGSYSLLVYFIYNYQKRIKPNSIALMIPFVVLLVFTLMSFNYSASFITDYWRQV